MWISKAAHELIEQARANATEAGTRFAAANAECLRLREENARLIATNAWMQHRLNQVEMERAMLMQDRIGVKISVPQFVPSMEDPSEALSKVVDISTIGADAKDDGSDVSDMNNPGVVYDNLPGYRGKR
jgi:hypothetical protein